jgi:thioredoxin 1
VCVCVCVCDFFSTSTWCQPCKRIQPFFEQLSSAYNNLTTIDFRTIDVDDFEDIATKYKVTMMPTFLVLEGEQILGTYKGSNEPELKKFLEEHASPSMTN